MQSNNNIGSVYLNLVRPISAGTDGDVHHLQIREVEAYDNNGNKLTLSIDSYSSESTAYPKENIIDGDYDSMFITYYPADITTDHFIKLLVNGVDDYCDIDYINVYNRNDVTVSGISSRIIGSYLEIIQGSQTIGDRFDITQDSEWYQFRINQLSAYSQDCSDPS